MNHSILLVVEIPDLSNVENSRLWERCINNLSLLTKQNKNIRLPAKNVVLIPLNKGLDGLLKAISAVGKFGYSYLFLNEETTLHEVANQV